MVTTYRMSIKYKLKIFILSILFKGIFGLDRKICMLLQRGSQATFILLRKNYAEIISLMLPYKAKAG
jgi:hypothetical protein